MVAYVGRKGKNKDPSAKETDIRCVSLATTGNIIIVITSKTEAYSCL